MCIHALKKVFSQILGPFLSVGGTEALSLALPYSTHCNVHSAKKMLNVIMMKIDLNRVYPLA